MTRVPEGTSPGAGGGLTVQRRRSEGRIERREPRGERVEGRTGCKFTVPLICMARKPSARRTPPGRPSRLPAPAAPAVGDEVQISDAANLIEKIQQMPDIRQDRVASIRQIAQGDYETPARLDAAVSRLLDEIG